MIRTADELAAGIRPDAPATVQVGGDWRGPTEQDWIARIARLSTPVRELVDGKFQRWINPERVA